jgi:hypothetical protein
MSTITPNKENIFFYWGGNISSSRLKILQDCIYSTRVFNPDRPIYLISNTLQQEQFEKRFNITVTSWDDSFFDDVPVSKEKIESYKKGNQREFCDLFRLTLLYKFGGSYIDTDDIAINAIVPVDTHNIVCRSYDPHTCGYNKIKYEDCIPGKYREVPGYDEINIFPRNDCWLNFEPNSTFIHEIITNEKFIQYDGIVFICDDFSWQSLTMDTCKRNIENIGKNFNLYLTLMYLYEGHVSASSHHDMCHFGGEFCDLWKTLPNINDYKWGHYKCEKDVALQMFEKAKIMLPYASHLWLHDKDMNAEWMLPSLDTHEKYAVSTWIINHIRTLIAEYPV